MIPDQKQIDFMELTKTLKINNELGLHARAAAKIVTLAGQYKASLFLRKDQQEVEGSSILSILTLACPRGAELQARAVGEDSEALLQALCNLFEQKFGEGK
jgi:phosphocarrier protein